MTLLDDIARTRAEGQTAKHPGPAEASPESSLETSPEEVWVEVCGFHDLTPDRGVCALVEGQPVAVFRCSPDDALFAIGNLDPYSGASVLSRGIVGSIGEQVVVASPVYKQRFDLRTGRSLADDDVTVPAYPSRVVGGRVLLRAAPGTSTDEMNDSSTDGTDIERNGVANVEAVAIPQ